MTKTKKQQMNLEERISDILEDCVEWCERPGQPGVGDESFNYERAIKDLKSLISDIVREVISVLEGKGKMGTTFKPARQKLLKKCKELGLEV